MKTSKNKKTSGRFSSALRASGLVAMVLCTGLSARAALSQNLLSLQSADQLSQQSLLQLSTGLRINSDNNDLLGSSPSYTWQKAAPNVLALSFNSPLQLANQQQQTLLQLFRGDDASSLAASESKLSQANQSLQSSVQTLQQADAAPQAVLQLLRGGDSQAASQQTLQQLSSQTLSLANDSLQTLDQAAETTSLVPSVDDAVQNNQLSRLSTGLKINNAVDPSQLVVSTENGLLLQLNQKNDGYEDKLGLNNAGLSVNNDSLKALFTDDAASIKALQSPLSLGDFVTVGHLNQDAAANFFQIAQSVNGSSLLSLARDDAAGLGNRYATSVVALKNLNSPYLFVSIRDLWGADDSEYNTAVLAINISQSNVHALLAAPEPSMYLILGGFLALAIWAKRRTDRVAATK